MKWHNIDIAKSYCLKSSTPQMIIFIVVLWLSNIVHALKKKIILPFDKSISFVQYLGFYFFLFGLLCRKLSLMVVPRYVKPHFPKSTYPSPSLLSPHFDISIVVTTYNLEDYVATCLDSLIYQSRGNIEIIVVDDHSSDKTYSILQDYQARYPAFIKILKNDEPKGNPSFGRNLGIMMASAPYVAFVDGDDWLRANAIALSLQAIEAHNPDIVFSGFKFFRDADGRELFFKSLSRQQNKNDNTLCFNVHTANDYFWNFMYNAACFKIFRTDFLHKYAISFPSLYLEDVGFSMQTYVAAERVVRIPQDIYFIRMQRKGRQTNRSATFSTQYAIDGLKNFELVNQLRHRLWSDDEDMKEKFYYKFYGFVEKMLWNYVGETQKTIFLEHLLDFYRGIGIDKIKFTYFSQVERNELMRILSFTPEQYALYVEMRSTRLTRLWALLSSFMKK